MFVTYDEAINKCDELLNFLQSINIEPDIKSHLESDYLEANKFVDDYNKFQSYLSETNKNKGREALGGLLELYKWIWSVKNSKEFSKLHEHLKLLAQCAPRINAEVPMLSQITGKQDDKSNKFIEAIIGMYAVKVGQNVDLDDPINSSGGINPDVIFDYFCSRIAIACKTLRGRSKETFLDNLRSAATQIERSACDFGYLAINAMNILPHDKIRDSIYDSLNEPMRILSEDIQSVYMDLRQEASDEVVEIFQGKKIRPAIITFIHSTTRMNTEFGITSTSFKSTFVTDLCIPEIDITPDIVFLAGLNEFIHDRL